MAAERSPKAFAQEPLSPALPLPPPPRLAGWGRPRTSLVHLRLAHGRVLVALDLARLLLLRELLLQHRLATTQQATTQQGKRGRGQRVNSGTLRGGVCRVGSSPKEDARGCGSHPPSPCPFRSSRCCACRSPPPYCRALSAATAAAAGGSRPQRAARGQPWHQENAHRRTSTAARPQHALKSPSNGHIDGGRARTARCVPWRRARPASCPSRRHCQPASRRSMRRPPRSWGASTPSASAAGPAHRRGGLGALLVPALQQ